jgi:chloramphenicol-sensitive protein RarD
MLDASLGYYIFPIFSVFLGKIFLNEKINRNKIIAITLVFISIIYLLIGFKNIPWIGLIVAITFSLYTLIRKKINISSDLGLFFETLLITPIALILFSSLVFNNTNIFGFDNLELSLYLFFAGFMTLIPLFMYIKGFELIGIGPASMIFFLTPTAQFFLSIFYLNQALDTEKLISFIFIWIAVLIYLNELRKE